MAAIGTATVTATSDGLDEGSVDVEIAEGMIVLGGDTYVYMYADGVEEAFHVVTITVTIRLNGEVVTTAENLLTLNVIGEGEKPGFIQKNAVNGEASFEKMKFRSTGIFTVEVSGEGLVKGEIDVTVVMVPVEGGTVYKESDFGTIEVDIPPNAASQELIVKIKGLEEIDIAKKNEIEAATKKIMDDRSVLIDNKFLEGSISMFKGYDDTNAEIDFLEFTSPTTISIPYPDNDGDGIIDGTDIGEEDLRICWLEDIEEGTGAPLPIERINWKIQEDSEVDTQKKTVKVGVNHFSVYGLVGKSTVGNLEITKAGNYPNPFSDTTVFIFTLGKGAKVSLKIYTISGRLINVLKDGELMDYGYNEVEWDGTDDNGDPLANGVYFYKITADVDNEIVEKTGKLLIIR